MNLKSAEAYLDRNGMSIIKIKGVIYVAVVESKEQSGFYAIEVLVDPEKYDTRFNLLSDYSLNRVDYRPDKIKEVVVNSIENKRKQIKSIVNKDTSRVEATLKLFKYDDITRFSEKLSREIDPSGTFQDYTIPKRAVEALQNFDISSINIGSTAVHGFSKLSQQQINDKVNSKISIIENDYESEKPKKKIIFQEAEIDFLGNNNPFLSMGNGIKNNDDTEHGTLGGILKLEGDDNFYMLSNWHVLMDVTGEINDEIDSSHFDDGNTSFAKLIWARFDRKFDMAIAKITKPELVNEETCNLCDGKKIGSVVAAKIGMEVKKVGYKTGTEIKEVIHSHKAWVKIKNRQIFRDQIIVKNSLSKKGDSGALLINNDGDVVGLVFAGDEKTFTLANPLHNILNKYIPPYTSIDNELYENVGGFKFEKFI